MTSIRIALPKLVLLPLLLLAACGDDSVTSNEPGATIAPKAGSSYTFMKVRTDSNSVKVPGWDTTYSQSVVSTGNSFRGKSNLVMFHEDSTDIFVSYESNGDYSMLPKTDDTTVAWITYPAGSRTRFTLPSVDTTVENPFGGTWQISSSGSIVHGGTATITVPAGTFRTHRLVQTSVFSLGSGASKLTTTSSDTIYYAPSIGWVVKVVGRTESSDALFPAEGTEEVLRSYSLK
jgi:hypothetical protein